MLSTDESCFVEVENKEEIPSVITNNDSPSWISMHVFEGHMNPSTFKLKCYIKSQVVSILVDSIYTQFHSDGGCYQIEIDYTCNKAIYMQ